MRHQERIYTQTNVECLRNKTYQTPFCSGDIDSFTNPTYQISGHTASTCSYAVQTSYTGVTYAAILATAVSACTSADTCLSAATWSVSVDTDGTNVYDGSTGTTGGFWTGSTATGATPSDVTLKLAIEAAFNTLGYTYSSSGMVFQIFKPWGTTLLEVNLCLSIELSSVMPCSGGRCPSNCSLIGSTSFPQATSSTGGVYIINDEAGVDEVTMNFVMNQPTVFTNERETVFRYSIYKYKPSTNRFVKPLIYDNGWFDETDSVGGEYFPETIKVSDLKLDGDYMVKGFFESNVTTEYRSLLGDKVLVPNDIPKSQYTDFNPDTDGYFISCYSASTPYFSLGGDINRLGSLIVMSFSADGTTNKFQIGNDIQGENIVALNGVTMARDLDYTVTTTSGSGFTYTDMEFLYPIVSGDIISYVYVSDGGTHSFRNDIITPKVAIVSGATDGQGSNDAYFNTTTGKYELYTTLLPVSPNNIYVSINGVILANNLDYYQSITNPRRIILEGDVIVGDVINLYYNSYVEVNGDIWFRDQPILWNIARPPQAVNGRFILQISDTESFATITQSATTNYVVGSNDYRDTVIFSGTVGQTYYYRVKNEKNYRTMCGDVIASEAYSEIVPAIVRTNSINSY